MGFLVLFAWLLERENLNPEAIQAVGYSPANHMSHNKRKNLTNESTDDDSSTDDECYVGKMDNLVAKKPAKSLLDVELTATGNPLPVYILLERLTKKQHSLASVLSNLLSDSKNVRKRIYIYSPVVVFQSQT